MQDYAPINEHNGGVLVEKPSSFHGGRDNPSDSKSRQRRSVDRRISYRERDRHHYHRRSPYNRDRNAGRHRYRSRSPSWRKSEHRRSPTRSPSKPKRVSGFDMPPPTTPLLPGAAMPVLLPAMTQQATRHARRVYVGGLSPTANEQSVAAFFNQVMNTVGGNTAGPGDAVINVYINYEKKFAFVEMRSVEEASNAMALDGIVFDGAPVKVKRPTDYNPCLASALGPCQPNPNLNLAAVGLTHGSAGSLEGPDRIFVGGLPHYFTETHVRELLQSFGELRGFDLVKDRETGNSKGYAFCVYQDLSVTDIACAALNGLKFGDKTFTVRRANQGAVQPTLDQEKLFLQAQQQAVALKNVFQSGGAQTATKVVCLTNMVANVDALRDDEEYQDIIEDARNGGEAFGVLARVVIPRPSPNTEPSSGLGKVFLEYSDVNAASKARQGLNGKKYDGNVVVAEFYAEDKFTQGDYDG